MGIVWKKQIFNIIYVYSTTITPIISLTFNTISIYRAIVTILITIQYGIKTIDRKVCCQEEFFKFSDFSLDIIKGICYTVSMMNDKNSIDEQAEREATALRRAGRSANSQHRRLRLAADDKAYAEKLFDDMLAEKNFSK